MQASIPTARGVGARAARTLRLHWRSLLVVAVVLFVPLGLLDVLDERFSEVDADEEGWQAIGLALAVAFVHASTALLGEVLFAGVVAAAVSEAHGAKSHPLGELVRSIPYRRLIAIDLLFALGFAAGLILLVIPGLIFFGYYALAAPVAKIEGIGVRAAFARSRQLVRGRLGLVLGVLIPVTLISEAASAAALSGGVWTLGHSFAGEWAGASASELVTASAWALAAVALVYELKQGESAAAPRSRDRFRRRRARAASRR